MMRAIIRQAWHRDGFEIWVVRQTATGYRVVKPSEIVFSEEVLASSGLLPEASFFIPRLDFESLRKSLSDEMLANGWALDQGQLVGELKATKTHLDDMRKLVFDLPKQEIVIGRSK